MPDHLKNALRWFDSPVVAAHWGSLGRGPEVLEKLCGENMYFDLSFGYSSIARDIAQAIIDKHGPDKLLFGSDMPWHRPSWELRLLHTLDISDEDMEKICFRNAQSLLSI
jgi:predicted TIM-barrel fold metal-dependent hydrolase